MDSGDYIVSSDLTGGKTNRRRNGSVVESRNESPTSVVGSTY